MREREGRTTDQEAWYTYAAMYQHRVKSCRQYHYASVYYGQPSLSFKRDVSDVLQKVVSAGRKHASMHGTINQENMYTHALA